MKLAGEYTFDAPQEMVWEALLDPDVLASVMPGGEGFEETGENEYAGKLKVKVGPVQGKFDGNIKLTDIVPPESYKMEVDGKGAPGFVKATGGLKLTAQGNQTLMDYEGEAQIGGRIASVGQRLMDASAKSIIRQSLEGLNEYLKIKAGSQEGAQDLVEAVEMEGEAETPPQAEMPVYTPPSQTKVAMNVAKDVASDFIPAKYQPVVIGIVIILVIILLYFLLT